MTTRTERITEIENDIDALEVSIQETDEFASDLAEDVADLEARIEDLESHDSDSDDDGFGLADIHAVLMLQLEMQAADTVLANTDIWGSGSSWGPELSPIHTRAKLIVEQRIKFASF